MIEGKQLNADASWGATDSHGPFISLWYFPESWSICKLSSLHWLGGIGSLVLVHSSEISKATASSGGGRRCIRSPRSSAVQAVLHLQNLGSVTGALAVECLTVHNNCTSLPELPTAVVVVVVAGQLLSTTCWCSWTFPGSSLDSIPISSTSHNNSRLQAPFPLRKQSVLHTHRHTSTIQSSSWRKLPACLECPNASTSTTATLLILQIAELITVASNLSSTLSSIYIQEGKRGYSKQLPTRKSFVFNLPKKAASIQRDITAPGPLDAAS